MECTYSLTVINILVGEKKVCSTFSIQNTFLRRSAPPPHLQAPDLRLLQFLLARLPTQPGLLFRLRPLPPSLPHLLARPGLNSSVFGVSSVFECSLSCCHSCCHSFCHSFAINFPSTLSSSLLSTLLSTLTLPPWTPTPTPSGTIGAAATAPSP